MSNPGAAGSSGDGLDSTIIPITSDVVNVIDADTCWEWDGGSACTYPTPLPDTPVIVPENVSLIYTDGAGQSYLIASSYPSPCGDGWQWGDNVVVLCPTACDFVTSDPAGSMRIVASCNMPHPIR